MECSNCMGLQIASSIITNKHTKHKKRSIKIIGSLRYYQYQSKKYIKECCYVRYYIAHYNESIIQSLISIKPFKNQRYIYWNNDTCKPVVELQYQTHEKLSKDPFSYPSIDSKLEIIREIQIKPVHGEYTILTPSMIERQMQSIKMDIDSHTLCDESIRQTIQYMYILKDRTAMETGSNIYKIGKTKQENLKRFKSYPKGFKLILLIACSNCDAIEKHVIQLFKRKYIQIKEYGNEYFQGSIQDMIRDITELII